MFHMEHPDFLKKVLLSTGLPVDKRIINQIIRYKQLIIYWSKKVNLVSRKDLNCLIDKHFIPSIWLSSIISGEKIKTILDIGTGAGFPGFVLKIINPEKEIVLLDSVRKKTLFLQEVSEELGLDVEIITDRIENVAHHVSKKFDVTVSRGIGHLKKILAWSNPILKHNGAMYAIKGYNCRSEIDEIIKMNYDLEIIEPDNNWKNLSQDIAKKIIVKVEKNERE